MQTIFPLSQAVITKIAAGEVIERPAYAVKELIENAIDAHADYITIHLEEAGLKKIIITDNGIGMSKEDVLESFKLHTTSKLSEKEQLQGIQTLGFRGEALASIAAISKLTIRSRKQTDTSGTEVIINNGKYEKTSPIGLAAGTTIIVEQLFHTVPARKKFLKTQATELRHIVETVTNCAIAFSHTRFFLTHQGRTLLDLPKDQTKKERLTFLLGKDIVEHCISLFHQDTYMEFSGYIVKPQMTTANNNKQYVFVNNRRVYDRDISLAVKNAYENLLEPQNYPIFLLHFTFPYETVDVNIHPRKELVDIANKQHVITTLQHIIKQTLADNNITFHNRRWQSDPLYDETTKNIFSPKKGLVTSYTGNLLKDSITPWSMFEKIGTDDTLIQLHHLYIVKQTQTGIELIDQHAAHERILFEQYSEEFLKNKKLFSVCALQNPIEISLSPAEQQTFEEYQTWIENLGFVVKKTDVIARSDNDEAISPYSHPPSGTDEQSEEFACSTVITHIPSLIQGKNIKKYFRELLEELSEKGMVKDIDTQNQKMLAYLACRSAVKAGERLNQQQMKELIGKLAVTQRNATCPHGRPTTVEISLSQLHTLFKRK